MTQHTRKSHFLGTKLRALRKRNGLTLEELSARCIQLDSQSAPSVSYLSMIESGKRVPSEEVLGLLSSLFQREPRWFLDGNPEMELTAFKQRAGGAAGVPLEPAFLFSKDLLQAAIPELLAQTGTTGRQFAHLLIRSHQRDVAQRLSRPRAIGGKRRRAQVSARRRRPDASLQAPRPDPALVRPKAGARARQGSRAAQHGALVF